jgi:hypothetical protein
MDWRSAIAQVKVKHGEKVIKGTAFLATANLALTALHVVADRHQEPPAFFKETIILRFPGYVTTATVVDGRWDREADWALLRCAQPSPNPPLPLARPAEEKVEWTGFGFPEANPDDGMTPSGQVENLDGSVRGVRALELYSRQAAAGNGMPVAGLSGAPVVVQGAAVGLLRWALLDNKERSIGGTLFACPMDTILDRCCDLLPCQSLLSRRDFLGFCSVLARSGTVLGAVALAHAMLYHHQEEPTPHSNGYQKPGAFLEAFLSSDWSIAPGDTNQHRLAQGKKGRSPYVDGLFRAMNHACVSSFKHYDTTAVPIDHPELALDKDANVLFIGGPVANKLTARLNEYEYKKVGNRQLPVFKRRGCLHWGFFCGTNDYGEWEGKKLTAKRYDEHGRLIAHPLYGLIDRSDPAPRLPEVDQDGFLLEDYLLVTRRPHPFFEGKRMTSMSGMHGYSLEAFANEIDKGMKFLDAVTKSRDCFQLMVPADLSHNSSVRRTVAQLRWDELDVWKLPDRSRDWISL